MILRPTSIADFRGPGVRRHHHDDSGDDSDHDPEHRSRGFGGRSGRIILLGDGTEILTDGDDTEMFDQTEEDKDLESQVSKGPNKAKAEKDEGRSEREATPNPQALADLEKPQTIQSAGIVNLSDTPSSKTSDTSKLSETKASPTGEASPEQIPAAALPEKLTNPPKPSEADKDVLKETTAAALAEKPVTTPKPT